MDLDLVQGFVALARDGRFTKAARRVGVSQPTLSRRVQRLEEAVGAKLVVRSAGGAVLTEAGERFARHAERALAAMESAMTELAELSGQPRGRVAIGTLATVGAYVLPPVIAAFHARHPEVRLSIREGFRDELEALVVRGELDLAIVQAPVRHEELTAIELWREEYLLAVPPGHRLAGTRRPIALVDVAAEPFVVIPGGTATDALERACATVGARPEIALLTDNIESVRRMVEAGLGLALVPSIMTRDARWQALLVPLADGDVHRRVAIVHRGQGYMTVAARAVRDAIVAERTAIVGTRRGARRPGRATPTR